MKFVTSFVTGVLIAGSMAAAETKVKMQELPPAVQKSVQEQTKGAKLVGLSKETEKGKTVYEVETTNGGRTRDLTLDETGAVVEVEQEVTLDSLPAPAKAAIEKKAAGGTIKKVESLTKGGTVTYEAAIVKGGKTSEIQVAADGSAAK
jgi:uncharacterized membrane protein YkoI